MVRPVAGDAAISFNPFNREFEIFYTDSLLLSGAEFRDYTVTVKCANSITTLSTDYNLRIKNPCINPNFLEFPQEVDMPDQVTYELCSGSLPISTNSLLQV